MRKILDLSAVFVVLALVAGACRAEDAVPAKFYKLDFVVKEVEGAKTHNARTYSTVAVSKEGRPTSIRSGGKVPYSDGKENTLLFVGVQIDCHELREAPNGLSLWVDADISSVPEPATNADRPFVRQNKWGSIVVVPLKKPTVIFSSDDVTSKRQMQLELTATAIP